MVRRKQPVRPVPLMSGDERVVRFTIRRGSLVLRFAALAVIVASLVVGFRAVGLIGTEGGQEETLPEVVRLEQGAFDAVTDFLDRRESVRAGRLSTFLRDPF